MGTAAMRRRMTDEERDALARLARATSATGGLAERARIVLVVLDGAPPAAIARQAGLPRTTVYSWLRRFARAGVGGLVNQPRGGQIRTARGGSSAP